MEKPLSFAVGDMVRCKKNKTYDIIDEAIFDDGIMSYSLVHEGAWRAHKDLTLIRRANKESLKELAELMEEEYDKGEE